MQTGFSPIPSRTFSRRAFVTLLGAGAVGALGHRADAAVGGEALGAGVIGQSRVGEAACGPCALANSLSHGDSGTRDAFQELPGGSAEARVETLIARYGTRPSETYGPRRGRYSPDAGLTADDMPYLANDVLAAGKRPGVRGEYLDSPGSEEEHAHLRRIHGLLATSLARGMPPVVEIRAFSADPTGHGTAAWVNLYAHWLALLAVEPTTLPPRASGFSCRFADSFTGRVIPGFAYAELYRPFNATRGFTMKADGTKDWHWVSGHPYVLLNVPDLPLLTQWRPWHERTLIALTYAVHR